MHLKNQFKKTNKLLEKRTVEQFEQNSQDVSLQIVATAEFDVWGPVHSRVYIELDETK